MPSHSSLVPPPVAPDHAVRRETILLRAEAIEREDYFTMLAAPRTATQPEIQAAYYALAKTWHPDRLPPELASVRDAASKVFARMSEAFETLSDPVRRKRYNDLLKGGGGTPEEADQIQQIIDVATDFQRAEILWKRNDAGAEKLIERVYKADPKQSDYIALWVALQITKRPTDAPVDDLIKLCDQAIQTTERCERAYFCRGTLKKRIGKVDSAMVDFRNAYELNPKNLDAAREVRLYEMRRSKHPERKSTPSPRRSTTPPAGKSNPPGRLRWPPARNRRIPRRKTGACCRELVSSSSVESARFLAREARRRVASAGARALALGAGCGQSAAPQERRIVPHRVPGCDETSNRLGSCSPRSAILRILPRQA